MRKQKKSNVISLCAYRKEKQARSSKEDSRSKQKTGPKDFSVISGPAKIYYMENYLKTKTPLQEFEFPKPKAFYPAKETGKILKFPSRERKRKQSSRPKDAPPGKLIPLYIKNKNEQFERVRREEDFPYSSKPSISRKALPYAMMAALMIFSLNIFLPNKNRGIASKNPSYRTLSSDQTQGNKLNPRQYMRSLKNRSFGKVILGDKPSSSE